MFGVVIDTGSTQHLQPQKQSVSRESNVRGGSDDEG